MFNKKLIRLFFIILITVLIFVVIFIKIDLRKVGVALTSVDLRLFILAAAVSIFFNIFVAADKWRMILKGLGSSISFKEALLIISGSMPVRFILPLKLGELSRAVYLKRRKRIGFDYGISITVFEKVMNLFGILIILCSALFFYGIGLSGVNVISPMVLCVFPVDRLKKLRSNLFDFLKRMVSVFGRLNYSKRMWLLAYSVFFQFSELITACILFKAVGLSIPAYIIFIYIPVVVLLSNIPLTIAGLGTREAAIIFLFSKYGPQELLFTSAILISFIEHILPTVIGLIFLSPFIKNTLHGDYMVGNDPG